MRRSARARRARRRLRRLPLAPLEIPSHNGGGEPGFEADRVPRFELKVEGGRLVRAEEPVTRRNRLPHEPHRSIAIRRVRQDSRGVGISTTVMDNQYPRYSTSEALLEVALEHARTRHSSRLGVVKVRAAVVYAPARATIRRARTFARGGAVVHRSIRRTA